MEEQQKMDELMTREQVRHLASRLGRNISGSVIFGESIIALMDQDAASIQQLQSERDAARAANLAALASMGEQDEAQGRLLARIARMEDERDSMQRLAKFYDDQCRKWIGLTTDEHEPDGTPAWGGKSHWIWLENICKRYVEMRVCLKGCQKFAAAALEEK